ncbi:MAG: hypothetical protein R2747_12615 [Pyrinomonadaceae bacterium]
MDQKNNGGIRNPKSETRNRICFLSTDSLEGYVSDDELAIPALHDFGWTVETVSWRDQKIDWNDFEAVIIRTPWDYQRAPEEFLRVLERIERSSARLANPLETVQWNLSKTYLRELEEKGAPIVPTVWGNFPIDERVFDRWLEDFGAEEIIVKPTISATAEDTYRLRDFWPELTEIFRDRPFMVQPFMKNIVAEGEFSLFYFGGELSHAILKTPKPKDFRVQEEFGGIITAIDPEKKLLEAGDRIFNFIEPTPLYARVDLVRDASADEFLLMELELIEPALYFRMNREAPRRFAGRFNEWMNEL